MKLLEIKEKISREEWVLPPFQREFVWNEEKKIIEFIESVFNEWPIGSIILWVPDPNESYKYYQRGNRNTYKNT